ncbi:MAG TPA: YncE family protein [Phycisphaerae bacterium]|nr:YncE family protein [Phycisphaerae bacterium]
MSRFSRRFAVLALVALGSMAFGAGAVRGADPQYKKIKDIQIGGTGGWDYLNADAESGRLYVSHGTKVVVIDTKEDKVIGEITNTPGVHGIAVANDLHRAFTSNGQGNNVSVIDLESKDDSGKPTFKTLSTIGTGQNPDAIMYDAKSGEVWTCNGRSSTFTAIDARTGKVVSDGVALGGKPETGAIDAAANRAYINIENRNEVAEIDLKEHKVLNHWPLAPATGPTGMAYVADLHRIIVGSSMMVLMDSTNGKVVATLKCGSGVDAAAYDPGTHLAFVSAGGDGTVTIAKVEADKLTLVQTLKTEPGARTMTVDTKTHRIYLANATPRTDPNAFKVLVFGIDEASTKP